MNKMFLLSTIFFVMISTVPVDAANVPQQPVEGEWVIDAANVLSESEFDKLNQKCNDIYLDTGRPIVILTIESYSQQNASSLEKSEYARFAFSEYGINDDRNENKAILVFMSEQDREFWIELGGGYEGENRDNYVQSVFDNDVKPLLGDDLWYEGLVAAVNGMEPILKGEEFDLISWLWVTALPLSLLLISIITVLRKNKIHKPNVRNWSNVSVSSFRDIRKINKSIISNIAIPEGMLSETEIKTLQSWNGVIGYQQMSDPMIEAFRELDKVLELGEFNITLEKYKPEMENIRKASELEEKFLYSQSSMGIRIALSSLIFFCIIYSLYISITNNWNYNFIDIFYLLSFELNQGKLPVWTIKFCSGGLITIIVFLAITGIIFNKIPDIELENQNNQQSVKYSHISSGGGLMREMGLIRGMNFFSEAKDRFQTEPDYTWSYHLHTDHDEGFFTSVAGLTSAERVERDEARSSGGGGGGGFDSGGSGGGGGGGGDF